MQPNDIMPIVEAVLFAAGDAVPLADIAAGLGLTELELRPVVDDMISRRRFERAGLQIVWQEDALQICTNPAYADHISAVLSPKQRRSLSQSVLETLSIIAYRQPITRREIEAIRGVKCDYSIDVLLKRNLICIAGQADTLGRPMLFATTGEFLRCFALESLAHLPPLEQGLAEQVQEPIEPPDDPGEQINFLP